MKELVVISGKGGTGKTSIVAAFASLAKNAVLADCDVDAADLHLVLDPKIRRREDFSGGSKAQVMPERCTGCGLCVRLCRFDAVHQSGPGSDGTSVVAAVDPIACEGCGVCVHFCPEKAIELFPAVNGEWFVSETRCGPLVHARLGVAEENSGKLVSLVRSHAKRIAQEKSLDLVLIDGSPGIGCPVIASITGADLVLVVTEPTLSGRHDLERVAALTKHFGIRTLVCINKWDLNEEMTARIEERALGLGLKTVGRIRYDQSVTRAQIARKSLVEYQDSGTAAEMMQVWCEVLEALNIEEK
ncbi:MAG: ATP-binding protein [Candidatus Omnitrophica bacterium]|nr:ATP-binding protein [Candidatus Omnitrophota bacterium]